MNVKLLLLLLSIVILSGIDFCSKFYIKSINDNANSGRIVVNSFINIVSARNAGISFGIFNNNSNNQTLLILTSVIFLLLLAIIVFDLVIGFCYQFAIALVCGGALGNIIDRIINGYVYDFIDIHILGYHWPSFNFADSFIVIGSLLFLFFEGFSIILSCKKF